ncbi:hypothetical protein [Nocardiopsis sp. HUAS JQ3]|uniref:hypothetical protein n=1 Tax=Nocardiopsis sp. HUAS JQ3 TaxID=3061629 RepID=UPI0023A9E4D2|nr:hypothetical protein [Nocardiopsis sp. HUAS JQ3]WDZ94101.1 hypothetical protein PV789_04135 [Nocardiopsis sp. HUAS JQ3]
MSSTTETPASGKGARRTRGRRRARRHLPLPPPVAAAAPAGQTRPTQQLYDSVGGDRPSQWPHCGTHLFD